MATFTDDAVPTPRNTVPQTAPYFFQRTYLCGHPDEFILVSRAPTHARLTHTLLSEEDYTITNKPAHFNNLIFPLQRCRACAIQARNNHQRQPRTRERSLATYQGAVIAGLETAGGKMRDGFQSVLDSFLGSRKARRKMHGIIEEEEEDGDGGELQQGFRVKTPEACQRDQPAKRVCVPTSKTVGGEEPCIARRAWDPSAETLCGSDASAESVDGDDALSKSLDGSDGTKRTNRPKEVDEINGIPSIPSASTSSTLSTDSLPSISMPSVPFPPSRIPVPRRSSQASLPRLRGGDSDSRDVSNNERVQDLGSGEDDCHGSLEPQHLDLHRSGSRNGWDDDAYEIDDYYFGTYSTSPLRSQGSHSEHPVIPREPVQTDRAPRIDSASSLPCDDDRKSCEVTRMCPRGSKRANKARRTGIVLEGQYDFDHMQKTMSPRDSMPPNGVAYFGDAPTSHYDCHDSDSGNTMSLQEALRKERPHYEERTSKGPQEVTHVSPKENMMSLQEALQAHRDFCIDRSSNNAYENDRDSYVEYSMSLNESRQNDQQKDFDIDLTELENTPVQSRESKASSIVPRGYLLNLKDAISKIAHDGLGDKAHKLSRIYTLQLNFHNSQRDSQRSDSPEFVCQSSSAIATSVRAKSARNHQRATGSVTSAYTSRTMWSSQSTFDLRTPDRRSAATGQRTNSSLSSSRPGSRLSSCPGSRPISSDTACTGDFGSATSATQYAKWRARRPKSIRNIKTTGHSVSPAIWTAKSVPSPFDINKRLPALPKVKPVLESSQSMECLQRNIW